MATYVPTNFSGAKTALVDMAEAITGSINNTESTIDHIRKQRVSMNQMKDAVPAGWATAVQFINAKAAANPGDSDWQGLKAEIDKVVADGLAEITRLDAIIAAIEAV